MNSQLLETITRLWIAGHREGNESRDLSFDIIEEQNGKETFAVILTANDEAGLASADQFMRSRYAPSAPPNLLISLIMLLELVHWAGCCPHEVMAVPNAEHLAFSLGTSIDVVRAMIKTTLNRIETTWKAGMFSSTFEDAVAVGRVAGLV
jgi:hypothetical protein